MLMNMEKLSFVEKKLIDYKQSEDERLKRFIPKTESEILRLKELIEILQ
jgi:hypothetical protein